MTSVPGASTPAPLDDALETRLAGTALLAAGAAMGLAGFGVLSFDLDWAWSICCALAGATLLASTRRTDGELYTGVIARAVGDDAGRRALMRGAVVALAPLAGLGPALYAAAALWYSLRAAPEAPRLESRRSIGSGLLCLAAALAAHRAGLTLGPEYVFWPLLLAGAGLPLFWSSVALRARSAERRAFDDADLTGYAGLILTVAAAVYVLDRGGLFEQAARTVVGTAAAAVVLALVVGPRWWRTSRLLAAERTRRARAEERTELARHLHDSVLQTLAVIQRRAGEPAEVSALARRQERELRRWLISGEPTVPPGASLATALASVVADVEDAHQVTIDAVAVGDRPLDERGRELVAATREALVNAARHGGGAEITVFTEIEPGRTAVYVRDRGPGFDPADVPPDRRGVKESILGRMQRQGGHASVHSQPGAGCEVELVLEDEPW